MTIDNNQQSKIAVLLVNFGGPKDLKSVKPFLYNLFLDPAILNIPFGALFRRPLSWLISNLRQFSSGAMYKRIGGKSPLIPITYEQKDALQKLLTKNEHNIDTFVGFRYSEPFIQDVLTEITEKGYEHVVILPLFPQYSYTTVGSVQLVVSDWLGKSQVPSPKFYFIDKWYFDEDYIMSFVDLIQSALKNLEIEKTEILFSAHSIPTVNIENGDPYEEEIHDTARLIIGKLRWEGSWHIGYQSKLGPIKWLEPSIDKVLEDIASKNKDTNVLVVPISFVNEHVETIYEIGILYKDIAEKLGIKKFVRIPALNTNKYLIQALYNQVIGSLNANGIQVKELLRL